MRRHDANFADLSMVMPADAAKHSTMTNAERGAVITRARLELLKLTFELSGEEHAQLEADLNRWINSDSSRVEKFWREPEKAVRQALRSQLRQAMAAQGLDMTRLEGN